MVKRLITLTFLLTLLFTSGAWADSFSIQQNQALKGKVVDEKGEPVIGATVLVVGTQNGTITDLDGNYTLQNVSKNATLRFSYIGFAEQDIAAGGKSVLNVTLREDVKTIDEVVVVGYGVQKKSNVTGAIASVKSEEIQNRSTENVGSALQGKLSGVQVLTTSGAPGASSSFRIRGYSSTVSSPDPLYLVDGLKVSSIDYLDPENIKSVEVLKDAASAAIYGSQAGNGVVLITTKTGANANGKIFYNNLFTFSNPIKSMKMMNASEFKDYWMESGRATAASFQGADTDWQDVMTETGFQQRHTIGAQGGNNNGSYYVSLTYLHNNGIVTGNMDRNERVTGQANGEYKIKPWLTVGTTNSIERGYTHTVSENNITGTGSAIGAAYYFDPTVPIYYENYSDAPAALGLLEAERNGLNVFRNEQGKLYGESLVMQSNLWNPMLMRNVYSAMFLTYDQAWRTNVNGTVYANITPFKDFVFTSRLGYRLNSTYQKAYNPPFYIVPTQISTTALIKGRNDNAAYYQWENYFNYLKTIGKHDFALMAGMEFAKNHFEIINASANGLTSTDENFRYLDYYDATAAQRLMGGSNYNRTNMSYFGRFGYTYDKKYMMQVNFRADAYDVSKLAAKNRWGYFPSVSLGWVFSNEKFMQKVNTDIMSYGKLRASWGINGNINSLTDFVYSNTMALTSSNYSLTNKGLITAAAPSTYLENQDLTWEKSKQYDAGVDLRFLKDRLSVTVDYYNKTTTGMLTSTAAPYVSGASSQYVNRGKIRNYGFEFEAGWKDKIGKLGYSINGNLSTVNNKVIESPNGEGRVAGGANFFMPITFLEAGQPMWYIRGYKHKGIDAQTGLPIYYTAEELGTDDGKTYLGSGIPKFTYGITLKLDYRNFDFTAFGSGVYGNEMFLAIYRPDLPVANMPEFVYNDRWTSSNTTNCKYPRANNTDGGMSGKYNSSDFFVYDASYFKLKQLQLGYTVPTSLLKNIYVSSLRLYVSGENLFTITDYPGNDPESMSSTYGNSISIDRINYPSTRNFIFGANITF